MVAELLGWSLLNKFIKLYTESNQNKAKFLWHFRMWALSAILDEYLFRQNYSGHLICLENYFPIFVVFECNLMLLEFSFDSSAFKVELSLYLLSSVTYVNR